MDTHLPEGRTINRLPEDHRLIQAAKAVALAESLDDKRPTGAVVVKDGEIIGQGANGSWFHKRFFCVRKLLRVKSGTKYWLCPGCWTSNHAEQKAIANTKKNGYDPTGADVYLWGHTYCCRWCWAKMIEHDIKEVYLPEV